MKANIKATITRGGGSVPKPLTYDYMPEGYPSKEDASFNITWDGVTDGHVFITVEEDGGYLLCKVSDRVFTEDECIGATMTGFGESVVISEEEVALVNGAVFIDSAAAIIIPTDNFSLNGIVFPEKGTYFGKNNNKGFTSSFSKAVVAYTPMSYDFMPEGYPKAKTFFDIVKTGTETVTSSSENYSDGYVKVSDMILTPDDVIGAMIVETNGDIEIINENMIDEYGTNFTASGSCCFISEDNVEVNGYMFPEKGVYFLTKNLSSRATRAAWPERLVKRNVEQISKEFLPNGIQWRGEAVIINSSTDGSAKKFKITVDDNGTLSATEVTDNG